MANSKHVEIVKRGAAAIALWNREHPREDLKLCGAHLFRANLTGANLAGADLGGANLDGANLRGANLGRAHLAGANLDGANLGEAHLFRANLDGANLTGAYFVGANLDGANLPPHQICPETGPFHLWKKAGGQVLELLVPACAKRVNGIGSRKIRVSEARVLNMFGAKELHSWYDPGFTYHEGNVVRPREPFCDDFREECGSGIHGFLTRQEAQEW